VIFSFGGKPKKESVQHFFKPTGISHKKDGFQTAGNPCFLGCFTKKSAMCKNISQSRRIGRFFFV